MVLADDFESLDFKKSDLLFFCCTAWFRLLGLGFDLEIERFGQRRDTVMSMIFSESSGDSGQKSLVLIWLAKLSSVLDQTWSTGEEQP